MREPRDREEEGGEAEAREATGTLTSRGIETRASKRTADEGRLGGREKCTAERETAEEKADDGAFATEELDSKDERMFEEEAVLPELDAVALAEAATDARRCLARISPLNFSISRPKERRSDWRFNHC